MLLSTACYPLLLEMIDAPRTISRMILTLMAPESQVTEVAKQNAVANAGDINGLLIPSVILHSIQCRPTHSPAAEENALAHPKLKPRLFSTGLRAPPQLGTGSFSS